MDNEDILEIAAKVNSDFGCVNRELLTKAGVPRKHFAKNGSITAAGGLEEFCNKNGLNYASENKMKAISSAIECNKKYGYVNTVMLKENYGVSSGALHQCGGVKKLCEDHGLNYRMALRYDPDYIIKMAVECYERHGKDMRQELFTKETGISTCAISNAFGTYNEMLSAANIPLYMHKHWNSDEIIEDVLMICDKYETTSSSVYRTHGAFSQIAIDKTFGSWENLLDMLCLPHMRKRYGKDRMASDLMRAYEKYGKLSKSIINNECEFTYEAALFIFHGVHGIEEELSLHDAFERPKSSGQIIIGECLNRLVGKDGYVEEKTFDWLVSPATNKNMFFDFYIPSLNKCIEFQGEQHYRYTPYFHDSEADFKMAVRRDMFKKILADSKHIPIVYFTYKDKITEDLVAKRIFE